MRLRFQEFPVVLPYLELHGDVPEFCRVALQEKLEELAEIVGHGQAALSLEYGPGPKARFPGLGSEAFLVVLAYGRKRSRRVSRRLPSPAARLS